MKRLTFRSVTAVGALMIAGIAGFAVQSADAERLEGQTEAQPIISQASESAPAGVADVPQATGLENQAEIPLRRNTAVPVGGAATDAAQPEPLKVPDAAEKKAEAVPEPTPVPLAGREKKDVRVVPIQKDVTEVPAPPAPLVEEAKAKTHVTLENEEKASLSKRQNLDVQLDLATVIRMPKDTSTIVVGNPIIADTTVQNNGMLVITGKSHGTTNIMALNNNGDLIKELLVTVVSSNPTVALTVQRGMDKETWSCSPTCQRTITLGDSSGYFGEVSGQVSSRNGISQSSGSTSR